MPYMFSLMPETFEPKKLMVSHSQVGVWGRCEKAWEYNYMQNIVTKKKTGGYELGTLVHELAAVYDQQLLYGARPGDLITWERVLHYIQEDWPQGKLLIDNLKLYNTAIRTVKRYILEYSKSMDDGVKVMGVEDEFNLELKTPKGRDFILRGFIDRTYLDENGNFWILDRKTSRTGRHYTDNQILMDPQLLVYAAAYRKLGQKVFGVAIDSISTYPYKAETFNTKPIDQLMKRIRSYRSPAEMNFILDHYGQVVDEIEDRLDTNEPFVRNLSRDCSYCQYMDLCLYEMKGIDTTYLREQNYEEKSQERGAMYVPANPFA